MKKMEIKSIVGRIFLEEDLNELYASIYKSIDEFVKMRNVERWSDNTDYAKMYNLEQVIRIYQMLGCIVYDWNRLHHYDEDDFERSNRIDRIESNLVEIRSYLKNS